MDCFPITLFLNEHEKLNDLYRELQLNENDEPFYVDYGDRLDVDYRSPNQITTFDDQGRILTYDSAQNYFQSEKAKIMSGPELAERVRLSNRPFQDGFVSHENFKRHESEWNQHKFDLAYKSNYLKFCRNNDLAIELLSTGKRPIKSIRNDRWKEVTETILMLLREILRRNYEGWQKTKETLDLLKSDETLANFQ